MRSTSLVCADASLLAKLALPEDDSDIALALWQSWTDQRIVVAAPTLIIYEFVSAVRQQIRKSLITPEQADKAIDDLLSLPLSLFGIIDLHKAAFRLAIDFDIGSTYDAHYLALAKMLDVELWTADGGMFAKAERTGMKVRRLES